ncbi:MULTISPECIES: Panacea domain-containing protein [unclassified Bradyrhizobium]|uniref:Panacea domain-containing protein n=1 Tax=unclassified Bradyrhizobium TaxID=2631580 RepID=UPI0028EEDFF8|nr:MULTISPECIES: type II toxin-antitoxin system antitoxin SocA domain-containing protein [unclassified Bradyrhizobium]
MSYDGRAVANFVLDRCAERKAEVSNLSLQKIVYFCHVWSLIELKSPLIAHRFEAWEYGPVLPYLYREFKSFDRSPIRGRATRIHSVTGRNEVVQYDFDNATTDVLTRVVEFYSRLRPGDLVELTHAVGGPWYTVWNHSGPINPGMKISDDQIVSFYSKRVPKFILQ